MNREQKAAAVQDIVDQLESADAVFAVDYRGISVPEAADLRGRLRDADATFRVVKNSLTERAADQAGAEGLRELLEGPTALTFVRGDAAVAAKALADFARVQTALEFKGGLMNGEALSADQIRSIARLPARDVLYGQLVGTVAAPVTGLVRGLNGLLSGLAVALGQIAEKGVLSEAPAAATSSDEAAAEAPATDGPAEAASDEATSQDPEADAPAEADTQTSPEAADGGEPAAEAEEEA